MSVVTNVLIAGMNFLDPEYNHSVIKALNAWLNNPEEDAPDRGQLVEISKEAARGCSKAMESFLWAGAFNYLEIDEFVAVWQKAIKETKGRGTRPQMLMSRQDDDKFHEIPNEYDGRTFHYRDTTQDTIPAYCVALKNTPYGLMLPDVWKVCDMPRGYSAIFYDTEVDCQLHLIKVRRELVQGVYKSGDVPTK